MNQQGVDWLEMALQPQKWPKKAKKWPKMVTFQKYLHVCGVGTLNLSQEMSNKMQNESGQFFYTEQRKRQKYGQN